MYIEEWHKCWCSCEAVNWVCSGNLEDYTVPDVHGFKCFKCGETNKFDLDLFEEDELYIVDGLESPN
jgi:hypothetical protein